MKIINLISAILFIFIASIANATTFYVDGSVGDDLGDGSVGDPKKYIESGIALLSESGGDTLTIADGTYSTTSDQITNIPNGTSGNYNIIKTTNDGGVIITVSAGLLMDHTDEYIQIEGFKFDYAGDKKIRGNHVKLLRCAFEGGGPVDNTSQVTIGTNDYSDTEYILLEDCWAYGEGGRYNFLIYNANYVVLRRCIVRHDGGWTDTKGDPEASFCVYNSTYVELQNCLAIDHNLDTYHGYDAAFYTVYNTASPNSTHHINHVGSMALNGLATGHSLDGNGAVTDVTISNSFVNDTVGGISAGQGHTVAVSNTLLGNTRGGSWGGGVGEWGGGNPTVIDSIIYNMVLDIDGFSASYIDRYGNDNTGSCSNCVDSDPETNGLLYLVQIKSNSTLATAGSTSGILGPTILKKMGTSGALWGESGYATLTADDLWPWPNEDRIKKDMAAFSTRGFCTTTGVQLDGVTEVTLTSYIWEYLGNQIPSDIYGASPITGSTVFMPGPGDGSVVAGSGSATVN